MSRPPGGTRQNPGADCVDKPVDSAGVTPLDRYSTALAVGFGLLLGVLARNVPAIIAGFVVPTTHGRGCGEEAIVECAVRAAPQAIGDIVVFGFLVVTITALCSVFGVALLVLGLRNGRPAPHSDPATDHATTSRSPTRFGRVSLGTSLLIPALWLVATTSGLV